MTRLGQILEPYGRCSARWPRQVGTDLQLADTDILLADQTDEPAV